MIPIHIRGCLEKRSDLKLISPLVTCSTWSKAPDNAILNPYAIEGIFPMGKNMSGWRQDSNDNTRMTLIATR